MFTLRKTWKKVFPPEKLHAVDVRVNAIDPAWPITAVPPTINVNPKCFHHQLRPAVQVAGQEAAKLHAAPKPMEPPLVSTCPSFVFQHQLRPAVQVAGQEAAKLHAAPKPMEPPLVSTCPSFVFQHQLRPAVQVAGQEAAKLHAAPKPMEPPLVSTQSQMSMPVPAPVASTSQ
ncbi:pre-mRNA cleavage complex 2 protein Pcf11-like isoform X2 [Cryptotermes secundus]|nr:pre-mRNA cleavage complex 2 protein Pcf11-like isoform X2 [Cryptotermes secundus]